MSQEPKKILFNAFHMCTPSQQWAGMWTHPDDRCLAYTTPDYYAELARTA